MTRAVAFEKGAAFELNGKTYYRCAGGRHTTQECLQVIGAIPTFTRAKTAGAL